MDSTSKAVAKAARDLAYARAKADQANKLSAYLSANSHRHTQVDHVRRDQQENKAHLERLAQRQAKEAREARKLRQQLAAIGERNAALDLADQGGDKN